MFCVVFLEWRENGVWVGGLDLYIDIQVGRRYKNAVGEVPQQTKHQHLYLLRWTSLDLIHVQPPNQTI